MCAHPKVWHCNCVCVFEFSISTRVSQSGRMQLHLFSGVLINSASSRLLSGQRICSSFILQKQNIVSSPGRPQYHFQSDSRIVTHCSSLEDPDETDLVANAQQRFTFLRIANNRYYWTHKQIPVISYRIYFYKNPLVANVCILNLCHKGKPRFRVLAGLGIISKIKWGNILD